MRLLFVFLFLYLSLAAFAQPTDCDDLQISTSLQVLQSDCDSTIIEAYPIGDPNLQWYVNGTLIAGATGRVFRIMGTADGDLVSLSVADNIFCNVTEYLINIPGGCPKEDCSNGVDDDGDGLIDLQDGEDCDCREPADQLQGNLFPNPGFEARRDVPGCERCYSAGQMYPCVDGWLPGNSITTLEHILRCFTLRFPSRFTPYVTTQSNFSMIGGFFAYDSSGFRIMESALVPLTEPTIPGERYRLVFEADLAGGDIFDLASGVSGDVFQYLSWYTSPVLDSFPYRFRSEQEVSFGGSWENWTMLDSVAIEVNESYALERFELEFTAPPIPIRAMAFAGAREQPFEDALTEVRRDYQVYWVMDNARLQRVLPPVVSPEEIDARVRVTPFQEGTTGDPCAAGLLLTVVEASGNTYQWYRDGIAISGATQSAFRISATALERQSYQVRVLNQGACKVSDPVIARRTEPFTLNFTIDSLTCGGAGDGQIEVEVSPPDATYSLAWADNFGADLGWGNQLTGLGEGEYFLTVTDTFGCGYPYSFTLAAPPPLSAMLAAEEVDCNAADGQAPLTVSPSGGTAPYEVYFNEEANPSRLPFRRPPGNYVARVVDATGCEIISNTVVVGAPSSFFVSLQSNDLSLRLGDATTVRLQSNQDLSTAAIAWLPEAWASCQDCAVATIKPLASGTLQAVVTAADGCVAIDSIDLRLIPDRSVYIPSAISPNGDGVNDVFLAYPGPAVEFITSMEIYDRWGNLQYRSGLERAAWAPEPVAGNGVYTYVVEVRYVDGATKVFSGSVTILR